MNNQSEIKEYIEGVLNVSRFDVLATEGDGQPHDNLKDNASRILKDL